MASSEWHLCLTSLLPWGKTFWFLWLSFFQPVPSFSLPHLNKKHILWCPGAPDMGCSVSPGNISLPRRAVCTPAFRKPRREVVFHSVVDKGNGCGWGNSKGALFLGCAVNQIAGDPGDSCHGKQEKEVGGSFLSPCSCLPRARVATSCFLSAKTRVRRQELGHSESHALLPTGPASLGGDHWLYCQAASPAAPLPPETSRHMPANGRQGNGNQWKLPQIHKQMTELEIFFKKINTYC